jgi:hypothetical protein
VTITDESRLTKAQKRIFGPKPINGWGRDATITAEVRYDDRCGNGHNSLAITAEIRRPGRGDIEAGGCMHEEIVKAFPELAPYVRWHLVSSDGPMAYIENTMYWLGYRGWCDGKPSSPPNLEHAKKTAVWPDMPAAFLAPPRVYVHTATPMGADPGDALLPEHALRVAETTQRFEQAETSVRKALEERLPTLLAEFRAAVESLGFTW